MPQHARAMSACLSIVSDCHSAALACEKAQSNWASHVARHLTSAPVPLSLCSPVCPPLQAVRGGVDVILNESSKRLTP